MLRTKMLNHIRLARVSVLTFQLSNKVALSPTSALPPNNGEADLTHEVAHLASIPTSELYATNTRHFD